jgi:hypothetical protein
MNERRPRSWVLLGGALALIACGGGKGGDDDDDDSRGGATTAGSGGSATGGAGAGPLGGTGGLGTAGSGAGTSGTPGVSGGGNGSGGGAGAPLGGGAGHAGSPAEPLSPADDPSRISTLPDCALAQTGTCVLPITRTKSEVCERFAKDWPKQAPTDYTLPSDDCTPATVGSGANEDAMRRLNFYRWLSGLAPASLNPEWSMHAAGCSIIQAHLEDINHYPPPDSDCYTQVGGDASSESLLDIGAHTPADSMDDLIWDWGQRNFHVLGHRWWLLHPTLSQVGIGFSYPSDGGRATCVRDTDGNYTDRAPDLSGAVAYPSFGRTPYELIDRSHHARPVDEPLEWSFSLGDDIDLSHATARVYRAGSSGYVPVAATSGPALEFPGFWIDLAEEPVASGTYLVLVSGTGLGDFGYRAVIEPCGEEAPLACDVLDQDCGVDGYGCYNPEAPYCAKSGKLAAGAACQGSQQSECAAGAVCVENYNARDAFACAAYCNASDTTAPDFCGKACLGGYIYLDDNQTGDIVGGFCEPGTGGSCDPLASNCPQGQGCYSWQPARCLGAGKLAKGAVCQYSNECEPGLACIGTTAENHCTPYCDMEATSGDQACSTLCPNAFWDYDDFGVCMP